MLAARHDDDDDEFESAPKNFLGKVHDWFKKGLFFNCKLIFIFQPVILSVWLQGKDKTQNCKSNSKKTSENLTVVLTIKKQRVQTILLMSKKMRVKLRSRMFSSFIDGNELIFWNFDGRTIEK